MEAVGVDGFRGGWVAVALDDGLFVRAVAARRFEEVLGAFPGAAAVGVDIPIGLPPPFPRQADLAARVFLEARAASVFSTFPRAVLDAEPFDKAVTVARELTGKGISRQAYGLRDKVRELDAIAPTDARIAEVHPEVSFRALTGSVLPPKSTWSGQALRRKALAAAGILLPSDLGPAGRVPPDDVLDAAIAAWSAARIIRGAAQALPVDAKPGEPVIRY